MASMAGSGKRITKVPLPSYLHPRDFDGHYTLHNSRLLISLKELGEIQSDPPEGIKVSLKDDSDLHTWQILMDGPEQSAYAVRLP